MKIACLISVADYQNGNNLPACKNDLSLIRTVLDATGEYEHILAIEVNQESSKVKQQIITFLKQFIDKIVDQVFFYYTGHGDFDGKEFYYLLRDYDRNRQKQTTIENAELDNWLRMLKPKLTVKIVDACHAGIQYIKDPDVFEQFLCSSPKEFSNCYFLFSSQKEQSSYQDKALSEFTKAIAEAIASFSGTEMRFKDMIDYVSDAFVTNANQTPFFIIQASNTEIFTTIDDRLRDRIRDEIDKHLSIIVRATTTTTIQGLPQRFTLVDLVKSDAQNYCTKDVMIECLNKIR
ncbi:MAG: caspase family protein, partial [Proteobacteria bacterium]|nr:caspase family protein [Pseudomonadota bacterium]